MADDGAAREAVALDAREADGQAPAAAGALAMLAVHLERADAGLVATGQQAHDVSDAHRRPRARCR
jgi:hypothetical protein